MAITPTKQNQGAVMKRMLEVNIPNEGQGYFPMNLYCVQVPDEFEFWLDPVYKLPMLAEDYWSAAADMLEEAYDAPSTFHFEISSFPPEWVDKGKIIAYDGADSANTDYDDFSDEEFAAIYIHIEILRLTKAEGIYSWRW